MNELKGLEIPRTRGRFTEAVAAFIESAPWLGAEHGPAVTALEAIAQELDNGKFSPALVAQLGLFHRQLLATNPDAISQQDPVADIINRGRAA